jgi:hypothetical protein
MKFLSPPPKYATCHAPIFDLITRVIGRPYIKKIKELLGEYNKRLGDIRRIHMKDHLQKFLNYLDLILAARNGYESYFTKNHERKWMFLYTPKPLHRFCCYIK